MYLPSVPAIDHEKTMPLEATILYPEAQNEKQGTDLNPTDSLDPSLDKPSWDQANSRQLNDPWVYNKYLFK